MAHQLAKIVPGEMAGRGVAENCTVLITRALQSHVAQYVEVAIIMERFGACSRNGGLPNPLRNAEGLP